MTLPALALPESHRPHLRLERRSTRRGRPQKLSTELRHLVCEWVEAGVSADEMRARLAAMGQPVHLATIYRYRSACPITGPIRVRLQCDACGARSSTGICPNGHPINPHY